MTQLKTYTKTIEVTEPRLVIQHDDNAINPRDDDDGNLGYFITVEKNRYSPDKNETLENIVKTTGDEVESQEDHKNAIMREIEAYTKEKVVAIYPIVRYEHGGVVYKLGTMHGFDYSNCGFYIITDKTQKANGSKKKDFEKVIKAELDMYNKYINGDVYCFILYDNEGDMIDNCGGYYDIETIRESLPKEWSKVNLSDYIK